MSCKTFMTRPVRLEPMVTCSHPRSVPTTLTVRSTVRRSIAAAVTGTLRTAASVLASGWAPAGEHPGSDVPTMAATPRPAASTRIMCDFMKLFRASLRRTFIETIQESADQRRRQTRSQRLLAVEKIERGDDDQAPVDRGAGALAAAGDDSGVGQAA